MYEILFKDVYFEHIIPQCLQRWHLKKKTFFCCCEATEGFFRFPFPVLSRPTKKPSRWVEIGFHLYFRLEHGLKLLRWVTIPALSRHKNHLLEKISWKWFQLVLGFPPNSELWQLVVNLLHLYVQLHCQKSPQSNNNLVVSFFCVQSYDEVINGIGGHDNDLLLTVLLN